MQSCGPDVNGVVHLRHSSLFGGPGCSMQKQKEGAGFLSVVGILGRFFVFVLAALGLHCSMLVFLIALHRLSNYGVQAWLPCSMWALSSPTKYQIYIPCTGRWILNHWTTRAAPLEGFKQCSCLV